MSAYTPEYYEKNRVAGKSGSHHAKGEAYEHLPLPAESKYGMQEAQSIEYDSRRQEPAHTHRLKIYKFTTCVIFNVSPDIS